MRTTSWRARSAVVVGLLAVAAADAKPSSKKAGAAPAPQAVPVVLPAPVSAPANAAAESTESNAALLARIRSLDAALEYDQVPPLAEALIKRPGISIDEQVEAYRYLASARAITADPVDAEQPFRMILRARPEFELPQETAPKILSVFRKVQSEERALSEQLRAVERARLIAGVKLLAEPPKEGKGGRPVSFSFRVRDPSNVVESVRVPYRREGQSAFNLLALERKPEGDWRGQIPGEVTANEGGARIEYYVEAADVSGPLVREGNERSPLVLSLTAGQVQTSRAPIPRWVFFSTAGAAGVLGLSAGGFGLALNSTQSRFNRLASSSGPVSGAELVALQQRGESYATATNASLIAAGVAVVVAGALAPFVDWSGEAASQN